MTDVADWIVAHAAEPIRAAELGRRLGLRPCAFSRLFRRVVGSSPQRYLQLARLTQARGLIAAGRPLAEVAHASGFSDQAHLTRVFKRWCGRTPGAYRHDCLRVADPVPAGSPRACE